jgi:hypothetical protein
VTPIKNEGKEECGMGKKLEEYSREELIEEIKSLKKRKNLVWFGKTKKRILSRNVKTKSLFLKKLLTLRLTKNLASQQI